MLIPVLLFIVGLLCLIKGGDWFVDGATGIARRFHVPELLIGATVVSIGTTLPEVMVSTTSAFTGHGEIAYGNAIGSIICNASLIAALTIAVKPGKVDPKSLRTPVLFFFVAAAFYAGVAYTTGYFSRPVGLILLAMFVATRTRCSFEVAAHDLGMEVTYLDPSGSQIGKKESIADTARVLGRMFDGIEYRGYGQQIVEDLAHYAGVPVWNGLTNEFHPTQILADFLTIREHFGHLKGINFVYFGDARYNMGNSLMVGCAKMGLNFTACAPKKYQPDAALVAECQKIAAETGATLTFEEDPAKAAKGADVLYTDVWVSMGEPVEVWAERINDLAAYQINQQLMDIAGPHAVFMHCLPAFHDHKTTVGKEMGERFGRDAMEVTDEVFEGPQSIVFDEAENRMHTIKAVMAATLGYVK